VKISRWEVAEKSSGLPYKKMAQPDASEPHFAPNWADFAQNFMNGVTP